jgi:phage terminase small subunit
MKSARGQNLPRMTPRQRKFITEYFSNGHNATQAALKAGYSKATAPCIGNQLIHRNKGTKDEIARLLALAAHKSEITAEWILKSLKEVADACKEPKVESVQLEDGQIVDRKRGVVDSAGANRALELLGKNQRLWLDSFEVVRRTEFSDKTDEELLAMIKASAKHKELE